MQCVLVMNRLAIINCDTMLGAILVLFQHLWVEVLTLACNTAGLLGTPPVCKLQFLMLMGAVSATLTVLVLGVFFVLRMRLGFVDSQVFFGISNNLHVELLGIMHGLKLTWEIGHRNVICYFDSLHAINLIQVPLNAWHFYATIVKNVKDLLNLPWNVQVDSHPSRGLRRIVVGTIFS